MQPTVKERHLSHGLSAQHETTYFAGTGAIQAIEQPAPVLSVCAGRGDPRLAVSKLHHLAWSRRPSCIELRRPATAELVAIERQLRLPHHDCLEPACWVGLRGKQPGRFGAVLGRNRRSSTRAREAERAACALTAWTRPGPDAPRWAIRWKPALNAFAITFGDRFLSAEAY
jgi:hypothetical protein